MGLTIAEAGGWAGLTARLLAGDDLTAAEAGSALDEVLAGRAEPVELAGFLVALRAKGETATEIAAFVAALRRHGESLVLDESRRSALVDTCGTGGDRTSSINVSTIAAFVVAGAGIPVCKHGNRAASSSSGSADVLEALGVAIDLGPAGVTRCLDEAGIGFCFAPRFHPALRHAGPTRRQLGVPTVFNFLGPLANPAGVRRQVVGVSDHRMAARLLDALVAGGATDAMVVCGDDGLDELSTTAPSRALVHRGGTTTALTVDPAALGLAPATVADLRGGDPAANAAAARAVLAGDPGPHRDVVLLNAAAGLVVGGAADDLPAGLALAAAAVDDGRAEAALDALVKASRSAAADEG